MFVKHFARTDTANLSYLAAELWLYAFLQWLFIRMKADLLTIYNIFTIIFTFTHYEN